MSTTAPLVPYGKNFQPVFEGYLAQIKDLIRKKTGHHDHRRNLFLNFLREGFGIKPQEIELEKRVIAEYSGYIDALYRHVIFEFKIDLKRENDDAMRELKKYFESQKDPRDYIALVTDGLNFEQYQYERGKTALLSKHTMRAADPLSSFRYLDSLLSTTTKQITPESADVASQFGIESGVFNNCRARLETAFRAVQETPHVKVKFDEWNSLLARVYGDRIGDERLFIRHTYLTMLSRIMVAKALFPTGLEGTKQFRGVVTGEFFSANNLPNLAEPDFFSWALDTEVEGEFIGVLMGLEHWTQRYRFDRVNEDLLKDIYEQLVDPESRHALGEYYTPDWIADVTLEAINYKEGRILDPACGSGTFFVAIIRRLRAAGVKGAKLVRQVIDSIVGIDVHPVAVMMAKANILLALADELKKCSATNLLLPIYMADTLMVYEEKASNTLRIKVSDSEEFLLPLKTIARGDDIDDIIDAMSRSCLNVRGDRDRLKVIWEGLRAKKFAHMEQEEWWFWQQNCFTLAELVRQGRDTIWSYILKNAYRPAFVRHLKVDYVVGNPPWLAYRYVSDKGYKGRIKQLTVALKLLPSNSTRLFTHMDTSTLFFEYARTSFLKPSGTIAFVMPRSVILPAQQHAGFQQLGMSEIHDFGAVTPVFNVPSVTIVRKPKNVRTQSISTVVYSGKLQKRNSDWSSVRKTIKRTRTTFEFLAMQVRSPYYKLFLQGATIVPKCFWYIEPARQSTMYPPSPYVQTSDDAHDEAKKPWDFRLTGRIEKQYLFETALSKSLIPFGILRTNAVFLPIKLQGKRIVVLNSQAVDREATLDAHGWLIRAEELWTEHRQSPDRDLTQWLNYNQKLTKQSVSAPFVVLFNTSGTNLTAAMFIRSERRKRVLPSNGFVAGHITYYYYPETIEEGDYLCAVLNSDVVNEAIKAYQPQGLYGERHVCRRALEVCAIPKFNPKNKLHARLADLGRLSREEVASYRDQLTGRLGQLRLEVKKLLKHHMQKINAEVTKLLEEEGQSLNSLNLRKTPTTNGELFEGDE